MKMGKTFVCVAMMSGASCALSAGAGEVLYNGIRLLNGLREKNEKSMMQVAPSPGADLTVSRNDRTLRRGPRLRLA